MKITIMIKSKCINVIPILMIYQKIQKNFSKEKQGFDSYMKEHVESYFRDSLHFLVSSSDDYFDYDAYFDFLDIELP